MAVRGLVVLDGRCALVLLIPHEYHTDRPLILWIGINGCIVVFVQWYMCGFVYSAIHSMYVYIYIYMI